MSRPRILIPIPTSFDPEYNAKSWPEYAAAIRAEGGDPLEVTLGRTRADLDSLVADAAGVLLPGSGADVNPDRYGHDRVDACADADLLREETDMALIEACERMKKPLLCICFGTQSYNVRHGGTLVQDLEPLPVNHRAGRAVAAAHAVVFAVDSRLGRILMTSGDAMADDDEFARIMVNSSHHQAVSIPGDELRVVARCPDDAVIEALESSDPDHWLLALQWHPERTVDSSAASRAIFADFIAATAV